MTDARRGLARLAFLAALLAGGPAQGALFQVTVDTTALNGQSAALGFDFLNGGDPPNNSVTISSFGTTGGTIGNAYLTTDLVTAGATSLSTPASSAVLSDAGGALFVEFLQYLTLGTEFTFTFSPTANAADPSSTPDTFLFYILVGTEPPPDPPELLPLLVESPDLGALVRFEIGVTDPDQPQVFQGQTIPEDDTEQPATIGVWATAVSVPEPGALALAIAGLLAFGVARPPRIRAFVKKSSV